MSITFFNILIFSASTVFTGIEIFLSLNNSSNNFHDLQTLKNFFNPSMVGYKCAGNILTHDLFDFFLKELSVSVNSKTRMNNFENYYLISLKIKRQGGSVKNFKSNDPNLFNINSVKEAISLLLPGSQQKQFDSVFTQNYIYE